MSRVRDLRRDELGWALEANQAAMPAVGSLDPPTLEHLYEQSELALAATDGDADEDSIAGFCLVLGPGADYRSVNYRWFRARFNHFVYLDRVVISPDHRARGLGRALYAEVERRATATWFTLEVNLRPRNQASLDFHHRLDFAEVGQQETDYGTLVSLMARRLG